MATATKNKPTTAAVECELCETALASGDTTICSICSAVIGPCCTSTLKSASAKPICAECEEAIGEEIEIEEEEDDEEDGDDDDDDGDDEDDDDGTEGDDDYDTTDDDDDEDEDTN